jgi:molybdenum-dependent DNA-binding transcriptional regulator ModE
MGHVKQAGMGSARQHQPSFTAFVVTATLGGPGGGGAILTPSGAEVLSPHP